MEKEQSGTLYVQMFGNFQMRYNGHPLTGEKMRDTHFTSLMQVLLHNVKSGVSRDYLEDVLLGDRDVENRHQALQTIVYKAKKKLEKMGLPKENYIALEKGIYHWTPHIPVSEDAAVFDRLCSQAAGCQEDEAKLRLYLEACYIYKGEFLSTYIGVLWAGAEARRYHKQFFGCVEEAAAILRGKEDWYRLEELGRNQMKHSYEVLDQIQRKLQEDSRDILGGYQCSYPVFQGIYHMVNRLMERGGQSVYLMLCTLVDGKGNPMKEGERLEEMSLRLNEAIKHSIRHGDIFNQYGSGQFLILLVNTTRENCDIVEKRISHNFMVGRQRTSVQYHVNSVICET